MGWTIWKRLITGLWHGKKGGGRGRKSQGARIEHILIKAQRLQNKLFSSQAILWSLNFALANESEFLNIIPKKHSTFAEIDQTCGTPFALCLLFMNDEAEILNFISWHKEQWICPSKRDADTALQSQQPSTTTHHLYLTTLQKD